MKHSSRRAFLVQLGTVTVAPRTLLQAAATGGLLFAGTYTDGNSTSRGIYSYRWDADAGELMLLGLAAATANPSFLALSPDRRHLYAVNELSEYRGEKSGSVTSFRLDGETGRLKAVNVVSSGGASPCKITLDFSGQAAFVANYGGGSVASYRVLHPGGLSKAVSKFQYSGHSINPQRQSAPHTHCTTVSPDNRYVLVNDLGLDRIFVYHLDPATAQLKANEPPFYAAIPGSGPRSFAFHPNGRWAYSLNEMASTVDALSWNAEQGTLTRFQNVSTLPVGFTGSNTGATVVVDAAGRFLYASNRGDNSIVTFSIDDNNGQLKMVQRMDCGGKTPRNFTLDPGNRWLLAANQDSANIVVFARDSHSGLLTATGKQYPLSAPVCLVFR